MRGGVHVPTDRTTGPLNSWTSVASNQDDWENEITGGLNKLYHEVGNLHLFLFLSSISFCPFLPFLFFLPGGARSFQSSLSFPLLSPGDARRVSTSWSVFFFASCRTRSWEKTRIPITKSFGRTIFYHTGSIAFAAFVEEADSTLHGLEGTAPAKVFAAEVAKWLADLARAICRTKGMLDGSAPAAPRFVGWIRSRGTSWTCWRTGQRTTGRNCLALASGTARACSPL